MSLFSFFNPFIIISYVLTLKYFWLTFYFDHPIAQTVLLLDLTGFKISVWSKTKKKTKNPAELIWGIKKIHTHDFTYLHHVY